MAIPPRAIEVDRELIQIVDARLAEAVRRSGEWIACRPGCAECCLGVFPINALDVARLRTALAELQSSAPARAAGVAARARAAVAQWGASYPGDITTGVLAEDAASRARFEDFANDEACPALDPATLRCELYAARPMTCRCFGPALFDDDGAVQACELCYGGATDEQIAACALAHDPGAREAAALATLEQETGARGSTVVAYAIALAGQCK
jgi:Fe-S-cluster containining protein